MTFYNADKQMIWKLTPSIWWGDHNSPKEAGTQVSAILCLCENPEFIKPEFSPLNLDPGIFYIRLARHDDNPPDSEYMAKLNGALDAVKHERLLIHCYAGQHRSPNTAVYAAVRQGGNYAKLFARMMQLRSDVQFRPFGAYLNKLSMMLTRITPLD